MSKNDNDMERIQQGLEQFLYEANKDTPKKTQRKEPELDIITERKSPRKTVVREVEAPVTYDLRDEKETAKKELKDAKKALREQERIERMRKEAARKKKQAAAKEKKNKDFDVIEVNNPPKKGKKGGNATEEKKPRKKGKLFFILSILCLLAVLWCYVMTGIYNKMHYVATPNLQNESLKEDGVVNILLIGCDSREQSDDEGRSDAMILMSISNKTHSVQMTSLLRDMYVDIPGHDGNRLNAAYAFGGPELLMETISQNLDIKVDRYVVVNFWAFANLVDAVGGVKLELSNDEVQWVNAYLNEYNLLQGLSIDNDYLDPSLSGEILLDGPQALAYSRNRYIGTDFGRTERQRKVLSAIIKKLPKGILTNPKGLVDGLFPNLTTNLSRGEFIYLSTIGWKLLAYDMEQNMIPNPGTYSDANIRGMAVLQVDFEANKKYLKQKIYGK